MKLWSFDTLRHYLAFFPAATAADVCLVLLEVLSAAKCVKGGIPPVVCIHLLITTYHAVDGFSIYVRLIHFSYF